MKAAVLVVVAMLVLASVAAAETIQVKAKGLVCDYCARSLEKVFKKRPEVQDISVDLTTKVISITVKEGQSLSDETINQLVHDSGYAVGEVHRV